LILALLLPALLLFTRTIDLFLAAIALLVALLAFTRAINLLLSLLFPTLLALAAVLLLFLTALFPTLLLLSLALLLPGLRLLLRGLTLLLLGLTLLLLFVAARVALLPALVARGLVLLTPLFSPASSALSIREITCSRQRGGDRKRQPDLFEISHFFSFLSVLTSGERVDAHIPWQLVFQEARPRKRKKTARICVFLRDDMGAPTHDMG